MLRQSLRQARIGAVEARLRRAALRTRCRIGFGSAPATAATAARLAGGGMRSAAYGTGLRHAVERMRGEADQGVMEV